ncbi:MAG: NOG1 family protein [Methanotrichaceae archaeon]|nr:NOG1 family protein [Methanotrichaceae archaeon]
MFEDLPTVPTSQELLDKAFRRAAKAGLTPGKDEIVILTAGNILSDNLSNLVRSFPSLENLPPFYREIADIAVNIDDMRISLSRLSWASKQVRRITREYKGNLKRGGETSINKKAAFGRMSSVLRSIDKDLVFLGEARNKLRRIPFVDPELPTILIAGYPNVGKSSFIALITGARPEIASYPFTTKGVIVGHFLRGYQKYQVVDTPGLLDRPLSERNEIERQSIAALSHLQGVVLFIVDPAEHCGYPLESQMRLADDLKNQIALPMLVVANKSDLKELEGVPQMSTLSGEGVNAVLEMLVSMLEIKKSA